MKVVHCKKEKYDVYIGRPSKWGNPYSHKEGTKAEFKVDTREEAIAKYMDYILNNKELLDDLPELIDQTLGCWCYPKTCHGDILVELVEKMYRKNEETKKILQKVKDNVSRGHYAPLPKEESEIVRKFYSEQIRLPDEAHNAIFHNETGTVIANGYNRMVVGDYGPYIEFTEDQIKLDNIEQRWPDTPDVGIKYVWMQTKDKEKTKVYFQKDTVAYADYKVGFYYVDPRVVFFKLPEEG